MIDLETWLKKSNAFMAILGFYLRRRPWRFWILIPILWWRLLLLVKYYTEPMYQEKVWDLILKKPLSVKTWKKMRPHYSSVFSFFKPEIVIGRIPEKLMAILVGPQIKVSGLPIDLDGKPIDKINSLNLTLAEISTHLYVIISPHFYRAYGRKLLNKRKSMIYSGDRLYHSYANYQVKSLLVNLRDIVILGFAALFITIIGIMIGTSRFNLLMTQDVISNTELLFFNWLPVWLLFLIAWTLLDNVGWAMILGSIIPLAIAIVNFFMFKYRNYPFSFSDIFLASEAKNMGTRYSYLLPYKQLLAIFIFIVFSLIIAKALKSVDNGKIRRIFFALIFGFTGIFTLNHVYQNDNFYTNIKKITRGNMWSFPNRYATNGIYFSFLNTTNKGGLDKPKGYNKAEALETLKKYSYENIPKDKRVNFITIQLEAYNDFSKWSNIQIDPSVYSDLNKIKEKGMSGNLTTTIFGGGTIDTERKMLTGYPSIETINHRMNSFVDYFNEQDYDTLALHPGYGWFYNRQNVDLYLGFNNFLYKENYYDKNVDGNFIVPDSKVFPDLLKHFEKVTEKGHKLFNQTVTYQNHGPYATTFTGKPLVKWQKGYNKQDYAIINNYLTGIKETNQALLKLVEKLDKSKEPVVLAFWGDHNPWGGSNNSTYKMLGINLNYRSSQGFHNYFDTPYVMWANSAAKKMMETDFNGIGPNISPMYILPTMFEHIGIKGSSYMQMLLKMKNDVQVFGYEAYIHQDKLLRKLPRSLQKEVNQLEKVVYYLKTNPVKSQEKWSK